VGLGSNIPFSLIKILVYKFNLCSETPLHIAAGMGYAEAVRILLNHGAGREDTRGYHGYGAVRTMEQVGRVKWTYSI
jgi:hypothetical protein